MKQLEEHQNNLLTTLRLNPLFCKSNSLKIEALVEHGTIEYWPAKTCLLDTDRTLFTFYIVLSGKLKMYNHDLANKRQLTLFLMHKHDVFDPISLLDQRCHKMYYETLEDTAVLSLPISKMRQWLLLNQHVYAGLVLYLSKRIRLLETYVIDATLEDTSTRLAKLLLKHMNITSQKIEVINNLSHDELAGLIGTTRAVFNRHIQYFKAQKIIIVKWKHIEIINLKELKQYAKATRKFNS